LRIAIIGLTLVCIGIAALSSYLGKRVAQRKNVDELVRLGGTFRIGRGPVNHIQVWYDDELAWLDNENRYAFNSSLSPDSGIKSWIGKWFGRDYVYSPIAIEVIKFNYPDHNILDSATIDHIRILRSVRQVAIRNFVMNDENVPREIVDEFIKTTFPNLVNASPQ